MSHASSQAMALTGVRTWFFETRPHFLLLSVALAMLGTSLAWYDGDFNGTYLLLGATGLLLLHASVNTFNDYYDYRSGIDLDTKRTPFSGGSGMLPAGALSAPSVYKFALICALITVPIAVYFVATQGLLLLPLLLIGAVAVLFYTQHLVKWGVGEVFAGLGLGMLPVLGMYFIQHGTYTLAAFIVAVPSGLLTHNLLFLNEFPDVEADIKGGRKHIVIRLGKRRAAILYAATTLMVYAWIAGAVAFRVMPVFALLGLLTLPQGIKAIRGAWHYDDPAKFMPGMGANVVVVLLTQVLVGAGYIIATMVK
jgi:1,4-dihydroxy-2-naphthoate octaprenyltransferase